jgi:hypothetical protein
VADEQTLDQLLRTCERSALHLEMRDAYMLDDPMLIAWQAGHRDDPADRDSWWRPWLDLMHKTTARGVDVRRARIVSEPVTDYIRFEYDITFTKHVRHALGQLLDYAASIAGHIQRLTALFPKQPDDVDVTLLHLYGIDCLFPEGRGFLRRQAPDASREHMQLVWNTPALS